MSRLSAMPPVKLGRTLVVALVIGSGVLRSASPTPAQRAYAIESVLRCPSCEDLSVAQSSASTAVTVRATVARQIAAGKSIAFLFTDDEADKEFKYYPVHRTLTEGLRLATPHAYTEAVETALEPFGGLTA